VITLYVDGYFVSPLDACCTVALDEKRLEYTTARALLRDGQGVPAALGSRSLIPRVPALQHGDFYLTESLAIVEYLEDTFPAPAYPRLWPAEPRARARARQLMTWIRVELHALREERPWWTCVYPAPEPAPLSVRASREAAALVEVAERMLANDQLGGWSIACVDLALTLFRLVRNGHALPATLSELVERELARPSVRAYLEHVRPPNPPPRPSGIG